MTTWRRQRRVRPPSSLHELTAWELHELAERGVITWSDVARVSRDRVIERVGYDPFFHLRHEEIPDD